MVRGDPLPVYILNQTVHWFFVGITLPVMVLYMTSKGLDLFEAGIAVSVYSATIILLELPTGGLSDSIGRKRVYIYSLMVSMISGTVLLLATGLPMFLAGYLLYGVARALSSGSMDAWFVDEFALHPDPRKLWSIAYPGITWGGSLEVISTHRGSANFFNGLVREVKEHGNPKNISLHRVTLEDALTDGFLYKLQQSLPADDEIQGMDEATYFDFVKSGCADEESFQQEYMCNPADDATAFLEYDLIAACEYGATENWRLSLDGRRPEGPLYAGLDIGRKKDLTVLWVLEKLGDVLYTREVIALRNMSKPDQEKVLWPWLARMNRGCLDYTGLGIGWGDDAKKKFGEYRIETVTFTPHVKEALAYPVRGAMEDRKLRIPYDPKIRADLRSVTKETTAAGNIRFTAERSEDGHADRFWALALAISAAGTDIGGPVEYQAVSRRRFSTTSDQSPTGVYRQRGAY